MQMKEWLDKELILLKDKEKAGNTVYLIGIVIELIVMMTDSIPSWTIPYRGRITHIAFVLFLFKILTNRYSIKEALLIVAVGVLGVISYVTCGDEYVIRVIVFLTASRGIEYDRVLKIILYGAAIGTAIIISMSLIGVCGNVVDIRDYGRGTIEARYCLGFNHANNVHDMLWYLISIYVLIRRDKTGWSDCIVMTIVNVALYALTLSRTGFITAQIIVIGAVLINKCKWIREGIIIQLSCIATLALVVFLTIYGSIYNIYDRKLVAVIDRILTGRLEMLTEFANFKDWMAFPYSRKAYNVDNGFSIVTYSYGTVIAALLIIVIIAMIMHLTAQQDSLRALILLGAVLVLFMESTFVINTSLLCNVIFIVMIGVVEKCPMYDL